MNKDITIGIFVTSLGYKQSLFFRGVEKASAEIGINYIVFPGVILRATGKKLVSGTSIFDMIDNQFDGLVIWLDGINQLVTMEEYAFLNERKTKCEAVVIANDYGLTEIIRFLTQKNISIPKDLAIIGYEDEASTEGLLSSQITTNLIMNAIEAINKPGGVIHITLKANSNSALFEVCDNGSGIDPENLVKIFNPLFTTKPFGKGTGLGLKIIKDLLEQMDGTIDVHSRIGKTVFIINLPVIKK